MLITIEITETYKKHKDVEIPDTGKLDEAQERINKMISLGEISLPSRDKEAKYDMSVTIL